LLFPSEQPVQRAVFSPFSLRCCYFTAESIFPPLEHNNRPPGGTTAPLNSDIPPLHITCKPADRFVSSALRKNAAVVSKKEAALIFFFAAVW
jgi:hypothetical protein